jgi:hypothetical protein
MVGFIYGSIQRKCKAMQNGINPKVVKTGFNHFEVRINGITVYETNSARKAHQEIKTGGFSHVI